MASAAAVWAVAGSLWLFPLLTNNSDEGAYLAQADSLRAGDLLPVAPSAHPDAYLPWFSTLRDGHYVYKYTPVHAGIVAASHVVFGTDRAALAIIAFAVVGLIALLARELGASRRGAVVACLVFTLSPLWLIISTTFLPYASSLALLLLFAFTLLRGVRLSSRRLLLTAGVAAGTAFFARPFDAAVFIAVVGGWVVWSARGSGRVRGLVGWCALGALPPLALFAAYNTVSAGGPFRLAFHLAGSADQLGFGGRRIHAGDPAFDYSPADGVVALANNVKLTITWAFGSVLLLAAAAVGFVHLQRRRAGLLMPLLLLAWPVAFFFFWGSYATVLVWRIADHIGPYYYLPMLVPLAIGGGVGILVVTRARGSLLAAVLVGFAVVTLITLAPAVRDNLERTANREAVQRRIDSIPSDRRAIVFVPQLAGAVLQHPFAFLRNQPGLTGDVVYAIDRGDANFDVLADHPERTPYALSVPRGYFDLEPGHDVDVSVDRVRRLAGTSIDVVVHVDQELARRHPEVRVDVGQRQLVVPVGSDGRAHFRVSAANHAVELSSGGGSPVVAPAAADTTLSVSVWTADQFVGAEGRAVPMRVRSGRIALLWPGSSVFDTLGPGEGFTTAATAVGGG